MDHALSGSGMRVAFAAVRSVPVPVHEEGEQGGSQAPPFVTISREGGAGGHTIGQRLVDRLNELDPGDEPWTLWDSALVEKVSADHHIAVELVQSLGEAHHNWMEEFFNSLSQVSENDEAKVYRRVAMTIRALAHRGRAVIVGRGGVYITREMPGGVHVRLVAALEHRIGFMMHQHGLTREAATVQVHELDRIRKGFFRRYWPQTVLDADVFTITLNTGMVDEQRAAEVVLPLILRASCVTVPQTRHSRAIAVA